MTVYRALEGLESKGLVHKLDKINAFVLCNHDAPHKVQIFLICQECQTVSEVEEQKVEGINWQTLTGAAEPSLFNPASARVELRGTCARCSA